MTLEELFGKNLRVGLEIPDILEGSLRDICRKDPCQKALRHGDILGEKGIPR